MATPLFILLRSHEPISLSTLVESIRKEPALKQSRLVPSMHPQTGDWSQLAIHYREGAKPIVISHYLLHECNLVVEGVLEELPQPPSSEIQQDAYLHASQARQAIRIDIDPSISEDVWAGIDCVEAFLAYQYDGLIFATDEGLYDESMTLLYPVSG